MAPRQRDQLFRVPDREGHGDVARQHLLQRPRHARGRPRLDVTRRRIAALPQPCRHRHSRRPFRRERHIRTRLQHERFVAASFDECRAEHGGVEPVNDAQAERARARSIASNDESPGMSAILAVGDPHEQLGRQRHIDAGPSAHS